MKKYNVIWEERHRITIRAKSEKQAVKIAHNTSEGEETFDEITAPAEAFEVFEIKDKGSCCAQVGEDFCKNRAALGSYCKKHADMFPL